MLYLTLSANFLHYPPVDSFNTCYGYIIRLKMSTTSYSSTDVFPQVSHTDVEDDVEMLNRERRVRSKADLRLCTIAGLLCSLNLLDSGIISSASVTSMPKDLGLDQGNRYSISILIFTVASVCFQLPATLAVRLVGPRIFFTGTTSCFGLITLVTILCDDSFYSAECCSVLLSFIIGDK